MNQLNIKIVITIGLLLRLQGAHAQWTYSNCPNVTDADFTQENLISVSSHPSLLEPLKMDFDMDAQGNVGIYFIQKAGEVKYYDGANQTITEIGNVNPETDVEDGLVGIALPPDFNTATTKYIFLYYSHSSGFRVSRFNLNATTKIMDMGTEAVLLTIPSGRGRWHTSGAMRFDSYGDLWINVGDNETAQKGPGNTNDLRGGILRIHPEADGTYSIPEGNLWEFAAEYFEGQGNTSVAEDYRDESMAKREIYAMGTRNAYTLTLDPVRRWATYGDCGPDEEPYNSTNQAQWTEEHTVVTEPAFLGWPYWTADDHIQTGFPIGYDEPNETDFWANVSSMSSDAPINNHPDAGVDNLLPATSGTNIYGHSCAMTGPIYRYNGDLPNTDKFPPHLNRVWFIADWNSDWIKAVRLNDQGQMQGTPQDFGINVRGVLDFQQGPDGALYVLNYGKAWNTSDANTAITRVSYTGSCHDPDLKLEEPVLSIPGKDRPTLFKNFNAGIFIPSNNGFQLKITNLSGEVLHSSSGDGEQHITFLDVVPQSTGPGIYFMTLKMNNRIQTEKILLK